MTNRIAGVTTSCTMKENIHGTNRQFVAWEEVSGTYSSDKGLTGRLHREQEQIKTTSANK